MFVWRVFAWSAFLLMGTGLWGLGSRRLQVTEPSQPGWTRGPLHLDLGEETAKPSGKNVNFCNEGQGREAELGIRIRHDLRKRN